MTELLLASPISACAPSPNHRTAPLRLEPGEPCTPRTNHQRRLAARAVGLPQPTDWQLVGRAAERDVFGQVPLRRIDLVPRFIAIVRTSPPSGGRPRLRPGRRSRRGPALDRSSNCPHKLLCLWTRRPVFAFAQGVLQLLELLDRFISPARFDPPVACMNVRHATRAADVERRGGRIHRRKRGTALATLHLRFAHAVIL